MNKKIIIFIAFVFIIISIKYFELDTYITFEKLKEQKEVLALYVNKNYLLSVFIFIFIYIFSVAFLLPFAALLTIASGFLFGVVFGTIYATLGATLGAILAFLFARYIIGTKIQNKYKTQLIKFNNEIQNNKYQYLFSIRLIPIFPFFLVNFLCGITKVDIKTFIISTYFGIIPAGFVFAYSGSSLASINSIADIFTKEILFAFIFLGILILIPTMIKKLKGN